MGNSLSLALYLATRARSEKGARDLDASGSPRENERFGIASHERCDHGPLIWFHIGQDRRGLAVQELARRMFAERDDLSFLVTTSADKRANSNACAVFQFAPEEALSSVKRFFDHWKPTVAIFTEPDLRPALISEASDRDVALFLIDANTAPVDPQAWRWFKGMAASLLGRFQWIMTGSPDVANTLKRLGAPSEKLETLGFLEEGTPALPCDEAERDALAKALDARPVWLAARITEAELDFVATAHRQAQRRSHRLLLIVVPQNPADGPVWEQLFVSKGFQVALRSKGDDPGPEQQVYIADTIDEMGLWYRLSPISFLGKTLAGNGGVNPYEPAALGSAIVHGPNTDEFAQPFARLEVAGASRRVHSAPELGIAVEELLSPDKAAKMAHSAWEISTCGAEVTDRVVDLILTELDVREGI